MAEASRRRQGTSGLDEISLIFSLSPLAEKQREIEREREREREREIEEAGFRTKSRFSC